ncbi:VWFA and cache domain-containing protein 1-like [Ptychodera flava]|uniref:VWFA and cache domain-containing protein 1-like n=1 Tax=Ptychodera flava TaxID=63121 RepID=UPI00396A0122
MLKSVYWTFVAIQFLTYSFVQTSNLLDVTKLSQKLTKLADDSLGVSFMQQHFNSLTFQSLTLDGERLIEQLHNSLSERFLSSVEAVQKLRDAVQSSISSAGSEWRQCCEFEEDELTYSSRFGRAIDTDTACERLSPDARNDASRLPVSVVDVMKRNYEDNSGIKWQFFGSEDGVFTIYPASSRSSCDDYDSRYRPWYVETATPEPKNVVIVIDKSSSMSIQHDGRTLMQIAKEAAITVVETMNPNDKVNVIAFSDTVSTPSRCEDTCYESQLAQATPPNKECLHDFVNTIHDGGSTVYSGALDAAFDLLQASERSDSQDREHVILFLTDGQPEDAVGDDVPESEEEFWRRHDIMQTIKTRNAKMGNKVIILTFGLGNQLDEVLLEAMAQQDGTDFGVPKDSSAGEIKVGRFTKVTNPNNLRVQMASYYNFFSTVVASDTPIFSVPYQAASGIGLLTTAALPVLEGGKLKGVVGVDITLQDLFADITYFHEGQSTYSFIYEVETSSMGRTLTHPLMPAPSTVEEDPVFVHITSLEREADFEDQVYTVSQGGDESGTATFTSTRTIPRGNAATEGVDTLRVPSTFLWRKVSGTPYVVCLVLGENEREAILTEQDPTGDDLAFIYHRLDLTSPPGLCRHYNRTATREASAVKFSKEAFLDPDEYAVSEETENRANAYMQYMNGETEQNAYFKDGVRDMVVATAKADEIWSTIEDVKQYTAFFYIGTENGVFREYPGVRLNKNYDHTVRPWYERAKNNKGNITLSPPYEAASGSGYVITLAHTIVERLSGATASGISDEVIAVMGMDFSLPYFSLFLRQIYPKCNETRYSCFVMDSSGYLITHDTFFDVSGAVKDGVEYTHITELEETIAQDLINRGVLVKKQCVNFQKIKLQNYYQVYKPESDIDTMPEGDPCLQYQLAYIPGTNAYIGIIEKTIRCIPAVCPCIQKECRKADKEDECECPCLSNAEYDYCNDLFTFRSDDAPSCTPLITSLDPVVTENRDLRSLQKCYPTDCSQFKTSMECIAAVSCEWCNEGIYEDKPFCFDLIYSCKPAKNTGTSSAGLIAGIVIAILLVVAIVIVIIVVWFIKRRNIGKPVPRADHIPVSYTASAAPSAPPAPSAPSFDPTAPVRGRDYFQPEAPTYNDPGEYRTYYQEPSPVDGRHPYQGLVRPQHSVTSQMSGHSYEVPVNADDSQNGDVGEPGSPDYTYHDVPLS